MPSLTQRAATVIEEILGDANAGPGAGLRISGATEPGGAESLEFALAAKPVAGDAIVHEGSANVFLDGVAATVLTGKTLDISAHEDHFHFTIEDRD